MNGKTIQRKGQAGEERAVWHLKQIGAVCIEKISTPMLNIKGRAVYCKSSSVDFTAAIPTPTGRLNFEPCRIEVKVCDDTKLVHSRIKPHQEKWLRDWHMIGFWSFVLWVNKGDCCMFRYPCESIFDRGMSISWERAKRISFK